MRKEFKSYMLNKEGVEKANLIADGFQNFLNELENYCPDSREMAIVRTKLEEACFFAKKAMAIVPENQINGVE